MYDRDFFQTKLGKASLASVFAMVLFVALSTQMQIEPALAVNATGAIVEIA